MLNSEIVRSLPSEGAGHFSSNEVQLHPPARREYGCFILNLVSNAVIHALEASVTALLSPITMWQWLSKHDRFMFILRVIIEVSLELIMLIVFAGVSILTTVSLILDDFYESEGSNNNTTNLNNKNENRTKT